MENLIENINNFKLDIQYTTPSYNPFRYAVIDDFLKTSYYNQLLKECDRLESNGKFRKFSASYAPEEQSQWKYCHLGAASIKHNYFNLFSTQSFKKFINDKFDDIELTNNITMELHKHPINDKDGWIHNDFDQANFIEDEVSSINGLNIWNYNTDYRKKENVPEIYQKNVRSIALIYYLNPKPKEWVLEDGGQTALYISGQDNLENIARSVAPIPNRLLIYEINPYSWHALKMKNKYERLSFHMWFHSDLQYSINKWKYTGHHPSDGE